MKYFPTFIVVGEALLSFYKYLEPRGFFGPSVLDIILGFVFLTMAYVVYKKPQNRILQWAVILLSLLLGPGGFIGLGGLSALLLAIYFMLLARKSKGNEPATPIK